MHSHLADLKPENIFFLFGMGNRKKLLYKRGISLSNSLYDKIQRLQLEKYPPDMSNDPYAALCWWEKSGIPANYLTNGFSNTMDYPYLGWAEAHFGKIDPPKQLSNPHYPFTWEANASQANYAKMALISQDFVKLKTACPHTWHAAEMFLYLIKLKRRIV